MELNPVKRRKKNFLRKDSAKETTGKASKD